MTKTGYIGFLEVGSEIECQHGDEKIKIVVRNILVNPDNESVLLYVDHHIGDKVSENKPLGLSNLHQWLNETEWTAVKTSR